MTKTQKFSSKTGIDTDKVELDKAGRKFPSCTINDQIGDTPLENEMDIVLDSQKLSECNAIVDVKYKDENMLRTTGACVNEKEQAVTTVKEEKENCLQNGEEKSPECSQAKDISYPIRRCERRWKNRFQRLKRSVIII